MKAVYEIVRYNLIGTTLYTKKLRPDVFYIKRNGKGVYVDLVGKDVLKSILWEYSTTPNKDAHDSSQPYLPYFADVTEDLPGYMKGLEAKTYKGCQLMTEKHGGYLQFFHPETKQILRIAMNSHYYTPLK